MTNDSRMEATPVLPVTPLGRGPVTARNVLIVASVLVMAKVLVLLATLYLFSGGNYETFLYLSTPRGFTSLVHAIATNWDAYLYQQIASTGYPPIRYSELYAFSPIYPALIYLGHFATGSYWTAALAVTNILGFVFPIVVLKLFDLRTALLAELFPVYLVYSMVGYSDVLALTFLSLALLAYVRKRRLLAGVLLAMAGLVFYDLLLASIAVGGYAVFRARKDGAGASTGARTAGALILPSAIAGLGVLVAYWVATGNPFTFLNLEQQLWSVGTTTPWGQVEWLYHGVGEGSFQFIPWTVLGVSLSSNYWTLRNLLFEVFFFVGAYLLSRLKDVPERWLLVSFSLLLSVPLLFVKGTPVYSIPRLLLPAFPIFLGYSRVLVNRNWKVALYALGCVLAACWVLLTFAVAFFA